MTPTKAETVVCAAEAVTSFSYQWEPISSGIAANIVAAPTPPRPQVCSAGLIDVPAANSPSLGATPDAPVPLSQR